MKKVFFIFIAFVLLIPINVLAESAVFTDGLGETVVMPMESELGPPIEATVTCTVPVTYKTIIDGVVTNEVTYYESVARITYRYRTSINRYGKYTGGVIVASGGYPKPMAVAAPHLNISLNKTAEPTGYVMPINNGDGYKVLIYGGALEITYNSVIYKNLNNETIGVESGTVSRAFYFEKTGP